MVACRAVVFAMTCIAIANTGPNNLWAVADEKTLAPSRNLQKLFSREWKWTLTPYKNGEEINTEQSFDDSPEEFDHSDTEKNNEEALHLEFNPDHTINDESRETSVSSEDDSDQVWSKPPYYSDESTENVTSGSFTTTPSQATTVKYELTECPEGMSLFSKEDIEYYVELVAQNKNVYGRLNNSYYDKAIEIKERHRNDLRDFVKWIKDHPTHLKDILTDIAIIREALKPSIANLSAAMSQYPRLQKNYSLKSTKFSVLLVIYEKEKKICELNNCDNILSRRSGADTLLISDLRECYSLGNLHQEIELNLDHFISSYTATLKKSIESYDTILREKVGLFKRYIKDLTLKVFGRPMYDVLNMQYEYRQFEKSIESIQKNLDLNMFNNNLNQIGVKILELENKLKAYSEYCTNCPQTITPLGSSVTVTMVWDVINAKISEITYNIAQDRDEIFLELTNVLTPNLGLEKEYLDILKPIQKEIAELTTNELNFLEDLKKDASLPDFDKFMDLKSDLDSLIQWIDATLNDLEKYWSQTFTNT